MKVPSKREKTAPQVSRSANTKPHLPSRFSSHEVSASHNTNLEKRAHVLDSHISAATEACEWASEISLITKGLSEKARGCGAIDVHSMLIVPRIP